MSTLSQSFVEADKKLKLHDFGFQLANRSLIGVESLQAFPRLKRLDVSSNLLTDDALKEILRCTTLTTLNIQKNQVGAACAAVAGSALLTGTHTRS